MKRCVQFLAAIPFVVAVLSVEPGGAVASQRTQPSTSAPGYWLITATGATYPYDAPYLAGVATNRAGEPLDDIDRTDCGNGPGTPIPEVTRCVGISATADGQAYWVGQSSYFVQGGVPRYADSGIPQGYVRGYCSGPGSAGADQPTLLVGIAAAPSGAWLVTSDGGVFPTCGAGSFGSMGGARLTAPMVGIAANPDGTGYWSVASDGGVFAFGGAPYVGSATGQVVGTPVVGVTSRR